ncbi:MAG: DUF2490 domain-containing protein [Flavobacteriales bacterium]
MKKIISVLVFSVAFSGFAQDIKKTQDLGLWMGVNANYVFKKDYTLTLSQDLRLNESITDLDRYITDLAIAYKINKQFKLAATVRYYLEKDAEKEYSQDFRYSLDFQFKKKINSRFKMKYRFRYQNVYEELFSGIPDGSKANLRNKIEVGYKLNKKHAAYFASEIFRKIVNYRAPFFNKLRLVVGDEFESRFGEFDFSLGYERELNSARPLNYYFARVYYTFDFKK